ncbi:rRNA maturation RNase YbeY [Carboxylicivirga caseinilyticus]|uniref:rRNA maturation RNase YbeY n=1 Tax=Carboxylicivirga caseinilyticus TaxID=3417572 RepID=UPI003D32877E|nr:rRNA maturation RNase YbeY [Marinilabiliaceae bacterium A049]
MVHFQSENGYVPEVITDVVRLWIESVTKSHGFQLGEINYFFCTDEYILQTNRQYLNHDYYTDIITFDYSLNNVISGDLIISLDTVKSNADLLNISYNTELLRVVIHGILHLCGFKDKTKEEEVKMRELEDQALNLYTTFK